MAVRLTPRQRKLLTRLADNMGVLDEDYLSHVVPGAPSRTEKTLSLLANRGLIDWSEGVLEIEITESGRRALGR